MFLLRMIDRAALAVLLSVAACFPVAVFARPCAVAEEVAAAVRVGMTEKEVLARVGEPNRRERFERTRTTAWDYPAHDAWGYMAEVAVVFDDEGHVIQVLRVRYGD